MIWVWIVLSMRRACSKGFRRLVARWYDATPNKRGLPGPACPVRETSLSAVSESVHAGRGRRARPRPSTRLSSGGRRSAARGERARVCTESRADVTDRTPRITLHRVAHGQRSSPLSKLCRRRVRSKKLKSCRKWRRRLRPLRLKPHVNRTEHIAPVRRASLRVRHASHIMYT